MVFGVRIDQALFGNGSLDFNFMVETVEFPYWELQRVEQQPSTGLTTWEQFSGNQSNISFGHYQEARNWVCLRNGWIQIGCRKTSFDVALESL